MAAEEERTWAYAGERWSNSKGTTYHVWYELDAQGKPVEDGDRWYAKNLVKLSVVGAIYTVIVEPQEDDPSKVSVFTSGPKAPRYTGEKVDDELYQTWWGKDNYASTRRAEKSALTKARKETPFDELMAELEKVSGRLNRTERRALAVLIMQALYI